MLNQRSRPSFFAIKIPSLKKGVHKRLAARLVGAGIGAEIGIGQDVRIGQDVLEQDFSERDLP